MRPNLAAVPGVSVLVITVMSDAMATVDFEADDVAALFRDHYPACVRALAVVCGDGELAADAVQEAFARAHTRWRTIRHYDDPVGWVRRVAINLLRDDRRRNTRKRRAVERMAAMTPATTPPPIEPDATEEIWRHCRGNSGRRPPCSTSTGSGRRGGHGDGDRAGLGQSHLHDARRSLRMKLGGER